jgi:hypothetical protein
MELLQWLQLLLLLLLPLLLPAAAAPCCTLKTKLPHTKQTSFILWPTASHAAAAELCHQQVAAASVTSKCHPPQHLSASL